MTDVEQVEEAIEQLASEHVEEVAAAMDYLREHADDAHEAVLVALTEYRGDQPNLARLLGEWGRPESVDALRDAVERGAYPLRYEAVRALARHGDPQASTALARLEESGEVEVRELVRRVRS
ncbi:MAG: HEAT repeat domain-containing protein [Acidimicrobiia bacterium]|nr:HEAT repeat domain-containing protein [Acidimicrobiia bacterium]